MRLRVGQRRMGRRVVILSPVVHGLSIACGAVTAIGRPRACAARSPLCSKNGFEASAVEEAPCCLNNCA